MRNLFLLTLVCVCLVGCSGSYADKDISAMQTCKAEGLDWKYVRLEAAGVPYDRVECVHAEGKQK